MVSYLYKYLLKPDKLSYSELPTVSFTTVEQKMFPPEQKRGTLKNRVDKEWKEI